MIKDFFNSIFQTSTERMKNPFISSFIIALIVINWKAILVILFSDLRIEERIEYTAANYINVENYLFLPLGIALFYTVILPYIMYGINQLVKFADDKKIIGYYDKEETKIARRILLAKSEVELERTRASSDNLSDLSEQIDDLSKTNKEKDNIIKDLQKDYETLKIEKAKEINKNNQMDNFPAGVDDNEFKSILRDRVKCEVLHELGKADRDGIHVTGEFFRKYRNVIKYFSSLNIINMSKVSTSGNEIGLTNKGRVYWRRLKDAEKLINRNSQ